MTHESISGTLKCSQLYVNNSNFNGVGQPMLFLPSLKLLGPCINEM